MSTASTTIKYEKRDGVAWITLNRPEVLNALNVEARTAMSEAFLDATDDDEVRVIILTAEGGRAFSAGMDLKERAQLDAGGPKSRTSPPGAEVPYNCPKPVIAAIDGYCLALGLELALACDIRIATEQSLLGLPEPRRSLLPYYGLHTMPRHIPTGEAMLILLTGANMTAKRAYDIGLIQALLPDRDSLLAEAARIAAEINLCAPLTVQAIKRIVKVGSNLPMEYSQKLAEPIQEFIDKTEDRLEGPRAFAEKRAPVWKMR